MTTRNASATTFLSEGDHKLAGGDAGGALRAYDKAIALHRGLATAHLRRGVALARLNRTPEAIQSYDRSLALEPANGEALFNLGNAQSSLGQHLAAIASYRAACTKLSEFPPVYINMGLALMAAEQWDTALVAFEVAIALEPKFAEARYGRARTLVALQRLEDAIAEYGRTIELQPDRAETYYNRGTAYRLAGRHLQAVADYGSALTKGFNTAAVYLDRAGVRLELGDHDDAMADCESALRLDPSCFGAVFTKAEIFRATGCYKEAVENYDLGLAIADRIAPAWTGRGDALFALGQAGEAVAAFDRALALDQTSSSAWIGRGQALLVLGRPDEASIAFQRALALSPNDDAARFSGARNALTKGDFELGWRLYEHRPKRALIDRSFKTARWTGQRPLQSKHLVLHAEQGLGDTLQFCRYAPLAAAQGATVHLVVQRPLIGILRSLEGVSSLVAEGDPLPDHDYFCPLMSLPLAFGTTIDTIPGTAPYLKADVAAVDRWRNRLGPTQRPRVGIVWNGGHRPDQPAYWAVNQRRNIDFEVFAGLNLPEIQFVSLQKGEPAESELRQKRAEFWPGSNLMDVAEDLQDFTDTAALIEMLDMVVTVDTSVAHLAGALGKPVWILNRVDSDWRWLLGRTDSPWYPTARLFRQPAPGDWASVIAEVRQALCKIAA